MTTEQLTYATPPENSSLDPQRYWVLAVIAVAQLMIVLDASVVIVALPSAQHALHISVANRQWVMSAYTLVFGSFLLLGGRIADYLGRRRVFVVGLLGFGVASALAGLAQNSAMLFGARALQGGFAAVMAPAALSLLTVTFTEPHERAWTLLINAPIAVITAFAAGRFVRESRVEVRHSYDLPGALTSTAGFFLLVYGFTMVASHGWGSSLTVSLLAGAVVLLSAFVAIEMRSAHPLLPLKVILEKNRGGSFLSSLFVGFALLGTFLFLTYFLQGILGYSALRTGFAFLPFSGGIIVGATFASQLLPRTGPRSLMVGGLSLATLGLFWFSRLGVDSSYLTHVLAPEILVSVGMGVAFVPMNSTALFGVEDDNAGVASALVNTTQQVGGALGTAFLNTVAASSTAAFLVSRVASTSVTRSATVHGYTTAFEVSALLVAVAAVVAGVLVSSRRHHLPAVSGPQ